MASIEKRSETSYRITVSAGYDANGKKIRKQKTISISAKLTERQRDKELNRIAVLFEQEVERGNYLDGEKITFAEFAQMWLSDHAEKQLSPSTITVYRSRLEKRIIPCLGHIKLAKLQPRHLLEFYNNLDESGTRLDTMYSPTEELKQLLAATSEKDIGISFKTSQRLKNGEKTNAATMEKITAFYGRKKLFIEIASELSDKTIKHHHDLICSILSTAVKWNIVTTNPAERLTPPKVVKKSMQYYEEEDVARLLTLLNAAHIAINTVIYLAIDTGLRSGELCGLTWLDIDFDLCRLAVNKQRQYVTGYGVITKKPKTKSGERFVTVSPMMMSLLKEYRTEQEAMREQVGVPFSEDDYIFTHEDGTPLHPHRPYKWFTEFTARNDLPKISFHALRHTNTSLMIAAGVDVVTMSGRLGHADKNITLRTYAHMLNSKEQQAANKMGELYEKILQ